MLKFIACKNLGVWQYLQETPWNPFLSLFCLLQSLCSVSPSPALSLPPSLALPLFPSCVWQGNNSYGDILYDPILPAYMCYIYTIHLWQKDKREWRIARLEPAWQPVAACGSGSCCLAGRCANWFCRLSLQGVISVEMWSRRASSVASHCLSVALTSMLFALNATSAQSCNRLMANANANCQLPEPSCNCQVATATATARCLCQLSMSIRPVSLRCFDVCCMSRAFVNDMRSATKWQR